MKNKIAAFFDTTSYRGFASGKNTDDVINSIKELKELEKKRNIDALAAPVVAMEMLSHLSDENDIYNYQDCLNGSITLAFHTLDENFKSNIIPNPIIQLCITFF